MADENYDQTFFLELAAKGKYAWNAWRRSPANKGVRVTFAGVDFSEAPRNGIDFSGFEFGDSANFSHCKWRGVEWVETSEAFKPGRACFTGVTFGNGVADPASTARPSVSGHVSTARPSATQLSSATYLLWIAVMGIYWALADYGRSVVRPAAWLVSSGFFFYWCYAKILAPLIPKAGPLVDKYEQSCGHGGAWQRRAFHRPPHHRGRGQEISFLRGRCHCLPILPEGFQLLVVGQNILLRNYFRIK